MQLVLNTPGAYLHCREGVFRVKVEDQVREEEQRAVVAGLARDAFLAGITRMVLEYALFKRPVTPA